MGGALKNLCQQMAQMDDMFAPFADKILTLADAGLAAAQNGVPNNGGPQATDLTAGAPSPSSPPGGGGAPFPG